MPQYRAEIIDSTIEGRENLFGKTILIAKINFTNRTGRPLLAIMHLLNNACYLAPNLRTLNVLVAGTLERHKFWSFAKNVNKLGLFNLK